MAWVGIAVSILLPILTCEFIYIPLVAVPAWRSVQWTTSLEVSEYTSPPAVALVVDSNSFASFLILECWLSYGFSVCVLDGICNIGPAKVEQNFISTYSYAVFSPVDQSCGDVYIDSPTNRYSSFVSISAEFTGAGTSLGKLDKH